MTLYLDSCCLNRPFDDQSQDRIRLEAESIVLILRHVKNGQLQWLSSDVVNYEIDQMTDLAKKREVKLLTKYASKIIEHGAKEVACGVELESLGFKPFDALHLACAEINGVDIFLTTDDKVLKMAQRFSTKIRIQVKNPLEWIKEVMNK